MFALILAEYAPEPVDILKVIKMALVHDLVEIDAGDTFLYDEAGNADKAERETKAADRIFALLPEEQGVANCVHYGKNLKKKRHPKQNLQAQWTDSNLFYTIATTQGRAWQEHGITADRVLQSNSHISIGAPVLWNRVQELVDEDGR